MNTSTIDSDMLFLSPSLQDWVRIESQFDWERFDLALSDFHLINDNSLGQFSSNLDLDAWIQCLNHRIFDVRKSYVFLVFYYEQGIPDDNWWSQDTGRIKYFPNFEPKHHFIKMNFDYYADAFYYKMFSTWDTIGQILNTAFNLGISNNEVIFSKAHKQLKTVRTALHANLNLLINKNEFKKAKKIRNSLTHNYPPMTIGSAISKKSPNSISLGVGQYTTSTEIKENVGEILKLLAKAIEFIKKQSP